jgi:ubiquitin-like 1-activating enzyme E1 B
MTECYDCTVKAAPKSFPVCTIRSTPSEPIHCIVWGKSYLLNKLFGEDDEALDEAELDKAKAEGENRELCPPVGLSSHPADEINNLKKEAAAFREVRRLLGDEGGPKRVFEKVFYDDINRLLSMEDMWKKEGRIKPLALEYDAIMAGTFEAPPPRTTSTTAPPPATTTSTLKDQKQLSLKDNLELFLDSSKRLAARVKAYPDVPLAFDKDDGDTLDFVLAVANLRAIAYRIATRTRFEVKRGYHLSRP